MEIWTALLGGSALSALIAGVFGLIQRHLDKKGWRNEINGRLDDIEEKQVTAEKDNLRTQLLLMLSDYPEEITEILTLAQHYFGVLKGDWYMTALFSRWLVVHDIGKPEWFNSKE